MREFLLETLQQALGGLDFAVLLVVFTIRVLYELDHQRYPDALGTHQGQLERNEHVIHEPVPVRLVRAVGQFRVRGEVMHRVQGDEEAGFPPGQPPVAAHPVKAFAAYQMPDAPGEHPFQAGRGNMLQKMLYGVEMGQTLQVKRLGKATYVGQQRLLRTAGQIVFVAGMDSNDTHGNRRRHQDRCGIHDAGHAPEIPHHLQQDVEAGQFVVYDSEEVGVVSEARALRLLAAASLVGT